jgi:hypothetical protein
MDSEKARTLEVNLKHHEVRKLRYMARSAELSVTRHAYAVMGQSAAGRDTLAMMSTMARESDNETNTVME